MSARNRKDLSVTAVHEAAHAVIAFRRGRLGVGSVTVVPDGDALGRCSTRRAIPISDSDWMLLEGEGAIDVCLAGPLAENRYTGRRGYDELGGGGIDRSGDVNIGVDANADFPRVVDAYWLLVEHAGLETEQTDYITSRIRRVQRELRRPEVWAAVLALAAELDRRKTIGVDDVTGLLMDRGLPFAVADARSWRKQARVARLAA